MLFPLNSKTIMMVTAADPVVWTQPEDVVYDPSKALPRLGFPGKPIQAAFFDIVNGRNPVYASWLTRV